ncbi:hypothetical protein A2823_01610 [Candidatus Nomurabacteria bacterium RIFCSPHIGHO2_01_FULL_41_91]|uniref:Uncharacterized protein n=1 Tax=Candidatus Nomurabacteria bacterium RIFCSPLOWO2_12_FULL_41_10 TaxID=1801795 RepID=A0A1F6YCD7_9BACT|nr:MAG: hypothetical protein A2823_01610 [Candidatus Nomurabacteria bacterium RIFCSPHIGHO2_01_FULL_41_91]OGI80886.1 MAG: hypothetical protein A3D43_00605 [Candidatus Nomurabacteria bacterium RIFCSPHIGHO2_02_FULL_41_52]OGI85191.1 MAG: hypothetical protein A3F49_03235 [Candidatus Nomurabacteria bacterium RIFCSPHIGHO2_12_FULL_42_19]OGI93590.1 MAG: hypothetical protein A3A07_02430 [Candidatus Nomurabacteria bacterium RIFCSPLOWO2_01_FULL_41_52]OGI99476.1 MAG: hypothetical protein A3H56_03285 [Candid
MNQGPPQGPPTIPTPEPGPKILTFEEFSHRDKVNYPRYGNFFMYFGGGQGDVFRTTAHYKKFALEYPDMATTLYEKIQNRPENKSGDSSDSLRPFDQDLYEAYKIMRGYGVPDKDLFS